MSRAETIYPIRRMLEKELKKIEQDPHNRELLTRYYKVRTSQVSPATVLFEFTRLNPISRMLGKKFEEASQKDIEDLVFRIEQLKNADNTKNKYYKLIKALFRWMHGMPKHEYPKEVKWITLKKVPLVTVRTEDLLSLEDVIRISECARYPRDKTLLQCIVDAGCRIGEMLTVKIGEVRFNDGGAVLYSDGKTGYQPLILTWSAKTLAHWLNMHPFKHDKEAPVFCLLERFEPAQLSYAAARTMLKDCVTRAGYEKRVWLHLLKHISSTEDASRGLPDTYRRYKHHWTPGSNMPAVYEHLSSDIIPNIQKETWKKYAGVDIAVKEKPQFRITKICEKCHADNPRDNLFCSNCTNPLCMEDSVDLNKIMDKIRRDPETLKKVIHAIV